jgi:3,4-dihydroxy 2-butanone 4-phosphate synthase/GTP cyclohydrolase II
MPLSPIPEIVAEMQAGRMVILVDEEDRENEGDLVLAAQHVTPEAINFMATHARGLICLTLTRARCEQIGLKPMVQHNGSSHGTAFTVSIEAAEGVSTGISAADRAHTTRVAVAPNARAADIVQPGHVFPLMAQDGGVLMRAGHTEAGCDLAALAGLEPAAVICEIMNDDGTMARLPDLERFAAHHGLKIGAIADLIEYRSRTESLIERVDARPMQTAFGTFQAQLYRDRAGSGVHLALVHGEPTKAREPVLVRVHEPLSALDFLDAEATTHSWNLQQALARMVQAESGVAVLLNAGESGAGFLQHFAALHQPAMPRGAAAALRTYGIGAQILRDLGVRRMRLLSAPRKMPSMTGFGLEVEGFEPPPASGASSASQAATVPANKVAAQHLA